MLGKKKSFQGCTNDSRFFSIVLLEKDITYRKMNDDEDKVNNIMVKISRDIFYKSYQMFYKYSNNEFVTFSCVNLFKRILKTLP